MLLKDYVVVVFTEDDETFHIESFDTYDLASDFRTNLCEVNGLDPCSFTCDIFYRDIFLRYGYHGSLICENLLSKKVLFSLHQH